jgi:hypothetical protein
MPLLRFLPENMPTKLVIDFIIASSIVKKSDTTIINGCSIQKNIYTGE